MSIANRENKKKFKIQTVKMQSHEQKKMEIIPNWENTKQKKKTKYQCKKTNYENTSTSRY